MTSTTSTPTRPGTATVSSVNHACDRVAERIEQLRGEDVQDIARDVARRMAAGEPWPADVAERLAAADARGRELHLAALVRGALQNARFALQP